MSRRPREYSNIKVYHIIIRGIDKQDIFYDEDDKVKFIDIIKDTKEKYNYEIYSYCLMNNHVHLIVYDKEKQISKIMQSIQVSYSFFFNKKYERVGHLFQNRFFSKKIEDREYLKVVCRYIHQNPQKAGIGKTENYKWSSYMEYVDKKYIINPKMLLMVFSLNKDEAKNEFIKFHNINNSSKEDEIRSLIEYELYEKMTDDDINKYICEIFEVNNATEILNCDNKIRDEKLVKLKKCLINVPITQLSRILGINRKIIERANVQKGQSPMDIGKNRQRR